MKLSVFFCPLILLLPLVFLAACDDQEKPLPTGHWWIAPDCVQEHEHKGYLPVFAGNGPCLAIDRDSITFMTEEGIVGQKAKFKYNRENDSWTGIMEGAAGVKLTMSDHDSMIFENLAGVVHEYRRAPKSHVNRTLAHQQEKAAELYKMAITLTDSSAAGQEVEGKLVHVTGILKCHKPVVDETLGTINHGIGLFSIVEKYVPAGKAGGKTEHAWQKIDPDKAGSLRQGINSQHFHITSALVYSDDVRLGSWKVPRQFLENVCGSKPIDIMAAHAPIASIQADGGKITGNTIYFGQNPADPVAGDVRVRYFYIPDSVTVTVVGTLKDGAFASYRIDDSHSLGKLFMGKVPLRVIF